MQVVAGHGAAVAVAVVEDTAATAAGTTAATSAERCVQMTL